jgi:hypothetical protein
MDLWEVAEYVGESLVLLGVVGEVYADRKKPERDNLAKRSQLVLIIGLGMALAALIGTNEYFNMTIADLRFRAASSEERAAKADLARVELEKNVQWRHLSDGARKALCEILPPQTGADETVVVTVWTDPEPALYAQQFKDTIGSCRPLPLPAGANANQGVALALPPWTFPLRSGVNLEFPAKDARVAAGLLDALKSNGVDAHIPPPNERQFPKTENRLIIVEPRAYLNPEEPKTTKDIAAKAR